MDTAIIIPIYKSHPSMLEEVSIRQTLRVLKRHSISFVCPFDLKTDFYSEILHSEECSAEFERFDNYYFSNTQTYNKLVLKRKFYRHFELFKYILIVQPDAFVFRDDLSYWTSLDYDYIGAPWFEGLDNPISNKLIGVGNGGFSLRKISTFSSLLESNDFYQHPVYSFHDLYHKYISGKYSRMRNNISLLYPLLLIKSIIKSFGYNNNLAFYQSKFNINEDLFISNYIPLTFSDFKIPSPVEAKYFSFETNPSFLYSCCNYNLPFGCHGWFKYEFDFWRPFIEKLGYKLSEFR